MKKIEKIASRPCGTAAPLGALRTKNTCGIGEFPSLEALADFCVPAGLRLIQLLPVNDTGTDSSPYSALSAFALNPVYISIENLPEYKKGSAQGELKKLKEIEGRARFSYPEVREGKLRILRDLYTENASAIGDDEDFLGWTAKNAPWVEPYGVFMELKEKHRDASWKEWPRAEQGLSRDKIHARWAADAGRDTRLFYAWVQFRAHGQFKKAADYVAKKGILLKGDVPILMNEDSVDVWANPELFDLSMRAGAPPDMYNVAGQNWGFPVYNWEAHRKTGYAWWKARLKAASAYYRGYRLDHILGFFRIFKIREGDVTAYLGRPDPLVPVTSKELAASGFSPERIRWLSQPHVPTQPCVDANGGDYLGTHGVLSAVMDRIGSEELWLFKDTVTGEKDILGLDIPEGVKDVLFHYWHNRTLVKTGSEKGADSFYPVWTCRSTTAWYSLSEQEKAALAALIEKKNKQMEKLWKAQGREILAVLKDASAMIPFAEDLGVNFKAVQKTLGDLSINSLKVIRWERYYGKEGDPFIPLNKYPALSVTATSVHDSSTARMWWEGEGDAEQFALANRAPADILGEARSGTYSVRAAAWFLGQAARTGSAFFICPIQDFFALSETYRSPDPASERINVPGTVNGANWTWRLPAALEDLGADRAFTGALSAVAKNHDS
ncbi:MAG: 4-alpha-glucanotransferase [Spirochaetaceae bacterium]|jgi:4-alpha-glucanotransferase|nr:4-alpha-glucanotransferase [Spirochaetaceae bacterium]